jgi:hypothetical protein
MTPQSHRATEAERKGIVEKVSFLFLLCGSVALWPFLLS